MARRPRAVDGSAEARQAWSVQEILELAVRHDLAELEVEAAGVRIRIVRRHAPAAAPPRVEAAPHRSAHEVAAAPAEPVPSNLVTIEAPMVGTFYRAPAPTSAPFVNEGDVVKDGQTLCIIEAMKLMNEIEAKAAGRIAKILVENGQPVEYGQPLFLVEPR